MSDLSDEITGLEVYVIYVDSEGNSLAVPSSLARAWNRPEIESAEEASTLTSSNLARRKILLTKKASIGQWRIWWELKSCP